MGRPMYRSPVRCPPCDKVALAAIEQEVKYWKLQTRRRRVLDDGRFIYAALHHPEREVTNLSIIFEAYVYLCLMGKCKIASLARAVDYQYTSSKLQWVRRKLLGFPIFDDLFKTGCQVADMGNGNANWKSFSAPLHWLCIMLVRGSPSITDTLTELAESDRLRKIDPDRDQILQKESLGEPWRREPYAATADDPVGPWFGVMLPQGVDFTEPAATTLYTVATNLDPVIVQFNARFFKIEAAYLTCVQNACNLTTPHTELHCHRG
ncbi:MAG: hypothetical protein L6R40_007555 [Gallowayella cf. fulva]|nr:MAG: hypothetical protein L6R40_007555 [Xanthomendoza cf. fulva]